MTEHNSSGLLSWIGHVHYMDGSVREVSVVTGAAEDKISALRKVCTAVGIASPNAPDVRGVVLSQDSGAAVKTVFGSRLRDRLTTPQKSTVTELKPRASKYRVMLYPTVYSGYVVEHDIQASSISDALLGVLKMHNVDDIAKAGDYVVHRYMPDGSLLEVLKKGNIPNKNAPASTQAPAITQTTSYQEYRAKVATETIVMLRPLIPVRKESSKDESH
jgi:hypothetical protein